MHWNADEARKNLPLFSLKRTALKNSCPELVTCPPEELIKYRPIDGSCNNLNQPDWGKSNTPFQRILSNAYADGIFEPRAASGGGQLPSPRSVSNTFIQMPPQTVSANFTLALMSWGQFVTHDLTLSATFTTGIHPNNSKNFNPLKIKILKLDEGMTPVCCNTTTGQHLDPEYLHPYCLPINVSITDPFYSQFNVTCMTFVRTAIGADYTCTLGHAEQVIFN